MDETEEKIVADVDQEAEANVDIKEGVEEELTFPKEEEFKLDLNHNRNENEIDLDLAKRSKMYLVTF